MFRFSFCFILLECKTHLAKKLNSQLVDLVLQDNYSSVGQDLSEVVGILGKDELEGDENLQKLV